MATAYIPGAVQGSKRPKPMLKAVAGGRPEAEGLAPTTLRMADLIPPASIAAKLAATTKRQALWAVADLAARTLPMKPHAIFEALIEREQSGSTGIGHGVAAPHARLAGVERITAVFARLAAPVEFEAVDEQPVDLIFALLAPLRSHTEHLRALARIARNLRSAKLRAALRNAAGAEEIRALLNDDERANPL